MKLTFLEFADEITGFYIIFARQFFIEIMSNKPLRILSTKILIPSQKSLLNNLIVRCEPFINVKIVDNKINLKAAHISALFPSKNAVEATLKEKNVPTSVFDKVFCVGEKTADTLCKYGINPIVGHTTADISSKICSYKLKELHCFVGNRSLINNHLSYWESNGIQVYSHLVYETQLISKHLCWVFDIALFFSPSAVEGYLLSKNNTQITAVCIGNSTGNIAEKHFKKVYIAPRPTVEDTLLLTNKISLNTF